MSLEKHQLEKILKYNADRMYFGNWSGTKLDDCYDKVSQTGEPQKFYVGDLTNDAICNTLWYEMSYNPIRFSTKSPFEHDGENDIIYFDDTYKQNVSYQMKEFLPDEIINLAWNINVFIKKLMKAGLYEDFTLNGKLPEYFNIAKAKSLTNDILSFGTEHGALKSLNDAVRAIANQNIHDLRDPKYQNEIVKIAQRRHPTGKRSDISYMLVQNTFEPKVITLDTITEKKLKKEAEVKSLEKEVEYMINAGFTESFYMLCPELDKLKAQYEELCEKERKLINKTARTNSER